MRAPAIPKILTSAELEARLREIEGEIQVGFWELQTHHFGPQLIERIRWSLSTIRTLAAERDELKRSEPERVRSLLAQRYGATSAAEQLRDERDALRTDLQAAREEIDRANVAARNLLFRLAPDFAQMSALPDVIGQLDPAIENALSRLRAELQNERKRVANLLTERSQSDATLNRVTRQLTQLEQELQAAKEDGERLHFQQLHEDRIGYAQLLEEENRLDPNGAGKQWNRYFGVIEYLEECLATRSAPERSEPQQ